MELEEMKQLWQKYDKTLQENKVLNERIISNMLNDKSGNSIRRLLNFEYFGLAVVGIVLVPFLVLFNHLGGSSSLVGCYIVSLAYLATALGWGIYKVRFLGATEPGNMGVTEIANRVEQFRLWLVKERMWGIITAPPALLAVYAVVNYWVHGENIFDHFAAYSPRIIIAIVGTIAGSLAVYSVVYFKGIRQIKANLEEIEKFRREG